MSALGLALHTKGGDTDGWLPEAGGGELVFHGDRVSVGEDENVLEGDRRDGCTITRMYLCHQTVHLKMAKMVNFMLCIFINNYN